MFRFLCLCGRRVWHCAHISVCSHFSWCTLVHLNISQDLFISRVMLWGHREFQYGSHHMKKPTFSHSPLCWNCKCDLKCTVWAYVLTYMLPHTYVHSYIRMDTFAWAQITGVESFVCILFSNVTCTHAKCQLFNIHTNVHTCVRTYVVCDSLSVRTKKLWWDYVYLGATYVRTLKQIWYHLPMYVWYSVYIHVRMYICCMWCYVVRTRLLKGHT